MLLESFEAAQHATKMEKCVALQRKNCREMKTHRILMNKGGLIMANTTFFQKAISTPNRITWKEIFSECRAKHTREDLEYALLAGTHLDSADESSMLNKWRKPWIFYRALIAALIAAVILIGTFYGSFLLLGGIAGEQDVLNVVAPMLIPLVLMIFFWELNIPRNISIWQLVAFFLVGAFLSLSMNMVMWKLIPNDSSASWAAAREEPAKLVAAVLIMLYLNKKGVKLYGLTGLAIGAAVGTGFSAFESVSYGLENGVPTIVLRLICAVVGHTVLCAPYAAALSLKSEDGKLTLKSFLSVEFVVTFVIAVACHAAWNNEVISKKLLSVYKPFGDLIYSINATSTVGRLLQQIADKAAYGVFMSAIFAIPLWGSTLWILRKSLNQIVEIGKVGKPEVSNGAASAAAWLVAKGGALDGQVYPLGAEQITIGRNPTNKVVFPASSHSVSGSHAVVYVVNGTVYLMDYGSTYGTFTQEHGKLTPNQPVALKPGSSFYLVDTSNTFTIQ